MTAETGAPARSVRLTVVGRSDFYAAHDSRADDEAFELSKALKEELPEYVKPRPAERQKGVITDVIVPLASSGALTAVVEVFKAWLAKQPAHRSIDLEFEVEGDAAAGRHGHLRMDATNVDGAVLGAIAQEALDDGK